MPAGTEHVDAAFIHVNRKLSVGLYRIRMEKNIMLSGNFPDFLNRLDRSYLIVGIHYGNQNGIRTDSFLKLVQLNYTIFVHIYVGDFTAIFFKIFTGMQYRMMFNLRCDNMLSLGCIGLCHSLQRPVIRF